MESLDGADAMGWAFTADAVYVSGHPGISRSNDGAAAFRPANDGLPDSAVPAIGAGGPTLYAADPRSGATESTDGGRTWHSLGGPPSAVWVSRSGTALYVSGPQGAGRSPDGGKTGRSWPCPPAPPWSRPTRTIPPSSTPASTTAMPCG